VAQPPQPWQQQQQPPLPPPQQPPLPPHQQKQQSSSSVMEISDSESEQPPPPPPPPAVLSPPLPVHPAARPNAQYTQQPPQLSTGYSPQVASAIAAAQALAAREAEARRSTQLPPAGATQASAAAAAAMQRPASAQPGAAGGRPPSPQVPVPSPAQHRASLGQPGAASPQAAPPPWLANTAQLQAQPVASEKRRRDPRLHPQQRRDQRLHEWRATAAGYRDHACLPPSSLPFSIPEGGGRAFQHPAWLPASLHACLAAGASAAELRRGRRNAQPELTVTALGCAGCPVLCCAGC
jgi:hypothetical protein